MIKVIGAYYGNSGRIKGAENGSRKLRDALPDEETKTEDGGYIDDFLHSGLHGADCLPEVVAFNRKLKDKVISNLEGGCKVLTIGGDHTIALGTMSASAEIARREGKRFGVLYIDAHGDLNTLENSPSKNLHGTTLAAFYGVGEPSMTALSDTNPDIRNLILIGTRSLDKGEKQLIEDRRIEILDAQTIKENILRSGIQPILSRLDSFMSRNRPEHIHLSFDIDAIDPSQAPGTGVPEKDGLDSHDTIAVINHIVSHYPVRTVDIVEFNSELDEDEKTFHICRTIVSQILKNWN